MKSHKIKKDKEVPHYNLQTQSTQMFIKALETLKKNILEVTAERRRKNPAYGQPSVLLYVCDSTLLSLLYHVSKPLPWVLSMPWFQVYAMGRCQYHKSKFIPWVNVYTMSQCIYHESMPLPWVHVYTMIPCLYQKSISIPWIHVYTMKNTIFRNTEIQITGIQKYKLHDYRNTNWWYTEIQITKMQEYK